MSASTQAEQVQKIVDLIKSEIKKSIKGKDEIIDTVLTAILSGGHILLEDMPGVGKTTLAIAISKSMDLSYNRVQFTPDVMPSDITGYTMYQKQSDSFAYVKGAALCNLFLADEINRTSSKTQSALLEVMEEGGVTVDNVTHEAPKPFIVIATQNPLGYAGTQMLPESQLDRFAVRISMGYPSPESELSILKSKQEIKAEQDKIISANTLLEMQKFIESVYISDELCGYIIEIANATRSHPLIEMGVSPRGTISLMRLGKAAAAIDGRDFVLPQDISALITPALGHRITLNSKARAADKSHEEILNDILEMTPPPRLINSAKIRK